MIAIIAIAIVVILIAIIAKLIRSNNPKRPASSSSEQSRIQQTTKFIVCISLVRCQYINLGKLSELSYGETYCYCTRRNEIVERRTNCPDFFETRL